MSRYIMRRVAALLPVLFGVSVVVFSIMKFIPGDPARLVAGMDAAEEDVQLIRHQLGLDRPLLAQYWVFISNAVRGDFGRSIRTHCAVSAELKMRFINTAQLALVAIVIAALFGTTCGLLAAAKQNTVWDNLIMVGSLVGVCVPIFWLGLMMISLFSVKLGWLPTSGKGSLSHLIMPSVTLGINSGAIIARMTRSTVVEVLRQDYIRTARAKGLAPHKVLFKHALKNAMIPILTVIGLQFGYLLAGAAITETVFAWPGIGRFLVEAIGYRDFPVVQASVLTIALLFAAVNLVVDVLYAYIDRRIQYD